MEPASFRIGRSNLYLLDSGDGLVLIDAGAPLRQAQGTAHPDAWATFTRWLSSQDHKPSDVRALLLTHAHPDHLALASALQRCGAQVFVHAAVADALAGRED
ncbi:MAG: MBL fold metallo-hydrolase, partial [Chloroflexi bacterium]|nr:MBL fold metallo-hydrolase [Chloroflexota bacterium]